MGWIASVRESNDGCLIRNLDMEWETGRGILPLHARNIHSSSRLTLSCEGLVGGKLDTLLLLSFG